MITFKSWERKRWRFSHRYLILLRTWIYPNESYVGPSYLRNYAEREDLALKAKRNNQCPELCYAVMINSPQLSGAQKAKAFLLFFVSCQGSVLSWTQIAGGSSPPSFCTAGVLPISSPTRIHSGPWPWSNTHCMVFKDNALSILSNWFTKLEMCYSHLVFNLFNIMT